MLFDWFTFGAQTLNFLILVWLLKRFLYKPILNAIDAREKLVAEELADADAKKAEAREEQQEFQRKNADFDRERDAMVSKASTEAKAEGERLLDVARHDAGSLSTKRDEALRRDARSLHQAITRRTQDVVFEIARKALSDLAGTSLEEQLSAVFTRRLSEMSSETKASLSKALETTSEPAVVRSAFKLPAKEQAVVQNALNEAFSAEVRVRFEVTPKIISGVELSCGGQKVGWSIEEYLTSLERGIDELLPARQPEAVTKSV